MPAPDLVRHRLHNQRLTTLGFARPQNVVAWLGAVQSQDYLGAKWSVGQRVANGTDAKVEQAFNRGHILRTHLLRPTWHFVTPRDIRWMLALTAPQIRRLNAYTYRKEGVNGEVFARARRLFEKELEGGNSRTREELQAVLATGRIRAEKIALAAIMMDLELEGVIVSGPLQGKRHTYALLEERVPKAPRLSREEALAELAHRFFTGHGPATLRDLAWWSSLTLRDCAAGLAAARHRLTSDRIDGTEWFGLADPPPRAPVRGALLLPEYDEALVGSRWIGFRDLAHGFATWTDRFLRPVLIDGRRAGTWRRTLGRRVRLEASLFIWPDATQRKKLAAAVSRYEKFLGTPVSLVR